MSLLLMVWVALPVYLGDLIVLGVEISHTNTGNRLSRNRGFRCPLDYTDHPESANHDRLPS